MAKIPMNVEQRDLFLVPFPFSDLSGNKIRPVIIISKDQFNKNSEDVIICGITSNISKGKHTINIDNKDLEKGHLFVPCCIKTENILKINKNLLIKQIGKLKPDTFSKVLKELYTLFE